MRIEQTDIYECGHSLDFLIDDDVAPSSSSHSVEVQSILNPVPGHCGCYNPDFCPDCDTPLPAPLSSALPPHIIRHVGLRHEHDDERVVVEEIEPDDVRFPEDLRPVEHEERIPLACPMSRRAYEDWLASISARAPVPPPSPSPSRRLPPEAPSRTTSMDDLASDLGEGEVRFHVAASNTPQSRPAVLTFSDKLPIVRNADRGKDKGKVPAKSMNVADSPSYASSAISPRTVTVKRKSEGNGCKKTGSTHSHLIAKDHSSHVDMNQPRVSISTAIQDLRKESELFERYIKYTSDLIDATDKLERRLDRVDDRYDEVTRIIAQVPGPDDLVDDFALEAQRRRALLELEILDDIRNLECSDDADEYLRDLRESHSSVRDVIEALRQDEQETRNREARRGEVKESEVEKKQREENTEKKEVEPHLRGGAHWADGRFIPSPTPSLRAGSLYEFDLDSLYGSDVSYHATNSLDDYSTSQPRTRYQPRPSILSRLRNTFSPRSSFKGKGKEPVPTPSLTHYGNPSWEAAYGRSSAPQGSYIWVPYTSRGDGRSRSRPLSLTRLAWGEPRYSNQRRTSSADTRPPSYYSPERTSSMRSRPGYWSPSELPATLTPPPESYKGKGKGKARIQSLEEDYISPNNLNLSAPTPREGSPGSPTLGSITAPIDTGIPSVQATLPPSSRCDLSPAAREIVTECEIIERHMHITNQSDLDNTTARSQRHLLQKRCDEALENMPAEVTRHQLFPQAIHLIRGQLALELSDEACEALTELDMLEVQLRIVGHLLDDPTEAGIHWNVLKDRHAELREKLVQVVHDDHVEAARKSMRAAKELLERMEVGKGSEERSLSVE